MIRTIGLENKLVRAKWNIAPIRQKIAGTCKLKDYVRFESDSRIELTFKDLTKHDISIFRETFKLGAFEGDTSIFIDIKAGFICDSTSLLWADDIYGDLHDVGYRIQGSKYGLTKELWDKAYKLAMQEAEFNKFLVWTRYNGVKYFGKRAYNQNRLRKYYRMSGSSTDDIINRMGL